MALSVVYESGILTLCESPKIYELYPEFDFLKKIPPTWDSTIFIDGNIAEYIIIARKHNDKWFVGGINSNYAREVIFNLSFIESGKYNSVIYSDTEQNPEKVIITSKVLSNLNKLKIKMSKGGGFAAIFEKIK
jgi:alpha-glucosidase